MKKLKDDDASIADPGTSGEGDQPEVARELVRKPSGTGPSPGHDPVTAPSPQTSPLKNLAGRFQRFMAAVAYAESGEADTALEIAYGQRKAKTVLLVVADMHLDKDAFRFATNLCRRIDASLDVLVVLREPPCHMEQMPGSADNSCSERIAQLVRLVSGNRIPFHISVTVGEVDKEVHSYTRVNKDVTVAVLDREPVHDQEPERARWERVLRRLSRTLAIPMITAHSKDPLGAVSTPLPTIQHP